MKNLYKNSSLYIKICGVFLLAVALLFIISIFIEPLALKQDMLATSLPSFSENHFLGTDGLGRDILLLTLAGTKSAILGPIIIAVGSLILGLILGSIAGYYGGALDFIISRYADIMISMPTLLLAIAVAGIIGGGYFVSVFVMIILYSPFDIRLVRSAVLEERKKSYIDAARLLKLSRPAIIAKQIFPNIAKLIFVNFFLNIAYGLVSMSSLSYLGLGVSPTKADWGRLLSDGQGFIFSNPSGVIAPGLMIVLTALTINVIGNYISDESTL